MANDAAVNASPRWRAVADCIDAYEAEAAADYPDLHRFLERAKPEDRRLALVELINVEMERRWKNNQPRSVESYLEEFPELADNASTILGLYQAEFGLRKRFGEPPTQEEYRNRFADFHAPRDPSESTDPRNIVTKPLTESETTRELKIVPVIGRYRVLNELGKGTFGIVYHCVDDLLHRDVAIKVMREEAAAEPVAAMLHEAQGAARLKHPAIVRVLDTGQTDDGRAYIVYEYVSGHTLKELLEEETYNRSEAIGWIAALADALHYAHKNGIVHRDVKPANILIDDDGCAHLTDFGLAKIDDQFVTDDTGRPVGTYCYMSPEQARGQSHWASPQSDIYSLGVILYELLTGRRPFVGDSISSLRSQVVRRPPAPPRTIDDSIPKALEGVCLRALAKEPGERYRTASDLAAELRAASRSASGSPKLRRVLKGLVVMAAAGLAAAVFVAFLTGSWPFQPSSSELERNKNEPQIKTADPHVPPHYYYAINLDRPGGPRGALKREHEPLQRGDALSLRLSIEPPGFLYVFRYTSEVECLYASKTVDSRVEIPGPGEGIVIEMEGPEMLLIGVSHTALDQQALSEFLSDQPPLEKKYEEIWQHPWRLSVRVQERSKTKTRPIRATADSAKDEAAETFRRKLETLFKADYFVRVLSNDPND